MMKNTVKKLIRWAMSDNDRPDEPERAYNTISMGSKSVSPNPSRHIDDNRGIHFTVFSATGGKVIQLQTYDPRTDRTNINLYVINDQEDLAEELALIITRESLSR